MGRRVQCLAVLVAGLGAAAASCPFAASGRDLPASHPPVLAQYPKPPQGYAQALAALPIAEVKAALVELMHTSQPQWPADYGHYGPFFVRLAWHCTGTYRTSDGRGGCDGARQRFEPERSWDDNTNLDKARELLWPIKKRFGVGLSWGDLIVLAGTTAIEEMGGPSLGFCAGRIDDAGAEWSQQLGPTAQQRERWPCEVNGECEAPLGSTTVGLIYVNPEGPMSQPLPDISAGQVRDVFGRMSLNDSETVALIGAHTFGKTHGACPLGAGPSPAQSPGNPWPGACGTGKGADAFTSGFEGPWTSEPTVWSNEYFANLVRYEWEVLKSPGDHFQWQTSDSRRPSAPGPAGGRQELMMLTTDVALLRDPAYAAIVAEFASNPAAFDHAFAHAWYKLTARDMGPATRCAGPLTPPAQPWQHPLPPPPAVLADFGSVAAVVGELLDGTPSATSLFVRMAWQCASTFRVSDYLGGCNGARLRLAPGKDWQANKGLDAALELLSPVKAKFGASLSWADLIVLAGTVALERAGSLPLPFCGGRTDATSGDGWAYLEWREFNDNARVTGGDLRERITLLGLTPREFVALSGGHSLGGMHKEVSGFVGAWTSDPARLEVEYYTNLLERAWEPFLTGAGQTQYKAAGAELYALPSDLLLVWDAELRGIAQEFAADEALFKEEFAAAWTRLMNVDRFDGPTGNVCDRQVAAA